MVQPISRSDCCPGDRSEARDVIGAGTNVTRHCVIVDDASERTLGWRATRHDATDREIGAVGGNWDREQRRIGSSQKHKSVCWWQRATRKTIFRRTIVVWSNGYQSCRRKRVRRGRGALEWFGNADHRAAETWFERSNRPGDGFGTWVSGSGWDTATRAAPGPFNARLDDVDPVVRFELGGNLFSARYRDADQSVGWGVERSCARKSCTSCDDDRWRWASPPRRIVQPNDRGARGEPRSHRSKRGRVARQKPRATWTSQLHRDSASVVIDWCDFDWRERLCDNPECVGVAHFGVSGESWRQSGIAQFDRQ